MSDSASDERVAGEGDLPLCPQWRDNPGNFPSVPSPPNSVLAVCDSDLRQRAVDAWLCAYRLRKVIDIWRSWFHQLKREGDADPGAAFRLWETAITCAEALWACGARIPTLRRDAPEGIAASLPDYPCGADGEWQNDPRLIASQTRLEDLDDLQGELFTFMTLLANSPSTAFDTPPTGPGRGRGEAGFAGRANDQGRAGQHEQGAAGHTGEQDAAGQAEGIAARKDREKTRRTKRRLEESNKETDKLKSQVYHFIQRLHRDGEKPANILAKLKADRDRMEQVRRAGLQANKKLIRAALVLPGQRERDAASRRKNQDSPSP
jgi:hypothetical protein